MQYVLWKLQTIRLLKSASKILRLKHYKKNVRHQKNNEESYAERLKVTVKATVKALILNNLTPHPFSHSYSKAMASPKRSACPRVVLVFGDFWQIYVEEFFLCVFGVCWVFL